MSLMNIRALGVASPRVLFRDLDLAVEAGDRVGLIAGNGAGKSTLLRCIAGQAEATTGEITRRRGLRVGFVEQDVPGALLDLTLAEAVRRALAPEDREANGWKVGLVLDMFDTPDAMRGRALRALSGGWQRLALIARAWIGDPDVLLLDEPTNHLDLERMAVLEDWIRYQTEGVAMVIASHDRAFLDNCTTRTLFLRTDVCRGYAHPFSRARDLLAEDDAAAEAKLAKEAKEAARLRKNAGQLKNVGINSGSDLLLKKVHDPRIGFVSITRVKASDDLRNMTVYVSAFGQDAAAKKRTLDGLKSATPFLEREVFRGLNIKVSPELVFRLDDSLEKGQQVLQSIKEAIAADAKPAEGAAEADADEDPD